MVDRRPATPAPTVELRLIGDREQVAQVVGWLVEHGFPAALSEPYAARAQDGRGRDPVRVIQRGLVTVSGLQAGAAGGRGPVRAESTLGDPPAALPGRRELGGRR